MEKRLLSPEFDLFFYFPNQESLIDAVWAEGQGESELIRVIANEQAQVRARLIACEVLWSRNFLALNTVNKSMLATIYCHALQTDVVGMANPWGFLYDFDDTGYLGARFLQLAEDAIPCLLDLARNDERAPLYEGSKEATVGNGQNYRLKDMAAYYIARIKNYPLKYHNEHPRRDSAISKMLALLE